ncbi:MAG: GNAT family N-acetyltransferase [Fournierella sp.]|uniref:GNAT family N-acetyltransferase n=1 Tax=Allofournierella sp. TaxID=1940256 RepID=UPI002A7F508C|nr:GNAT family N-acetyltransferase [Fournierella sp.]MDY4167509.1 GNAT family N-acetyltransferase [Fournierella sp.]
MELTIEPVTEKNRSVAEQLNVHPAQSGFIESVKDCMWEADQLKDWKPVCIIHKGVMVGFAMYGRIREKKYTRLWFDRLLIDKNHQGRGYAKTAMKLILQTMKHQYPHMDIYLSVYEENHVAISLYRSYGFKFTGELDTKGEKIMILPYDCSTTL